MIKTDVLVVGAGAAGAALGYLLKNTGTDVLLLEMQDAQKKNKLCAGLLEARAEKAFAAVFGETADEAGLSPMPVKRVCGRYQDFELFKAMPKQKATADPDFERASTHKSFGTYLRDAFRSGGKMVIRHALGYRLDRDFSYRVLPRKRLDDYILDRYLSLGGKVLDRCTVRSIDEERGVANCVNLVTKETFDIEYQTIVGADGAASIVRRLLDGRKQRTMLALEASVPLNGRDIIVRLTKNADGYCWYIPRGEDATVGCCYHELREKAGDIFRERLASFCAETGVSMPPKLRGALIPEGDDVLLHAGKRAYLLGDAAGLADAFTGGGIHYALLSAKALADALAGGEAYEKTMRPHVDFVKKNADNVGFYYSAARSVIKKMGYPIEDRK